MMLQKILPVQNQLLMGPRMLRQFAAINNKSAQVYQIETEYLINTARVRIALPTRGDAWFFINKNLSIDKFKQQCTQEDGSIQNIAVTKGDEHKSVDDNLCLYDLLADRKAPLNLQINNICYQFDTLKKAQTQTIEIQETSDWYKQCKDVGMEDLQSNTVSTMLEQLSKNIVYDQQTAKNTKGGAQSATTIQNVTDTFVKRTAFFENAIVRENLFQLHAKKMVIQSELDDLQVRYVEIEKKEISRRMNIFRGLSMFFTAQFLVGYYTIFEVDWLGWDLVEPLTYTVGQGSFIIGLFYMLRNRGINVEYTDLEDHFVARQRRRWRDKYNFDVQRYEFLKTQCELIDAQISRTELQRFD